jgi:tetratricopeptide (TPR) repeat protein
MSEENQALLPKATGKFFKESEIVFTFGWLFLDKPPRSYKIKFEGENALPEEAVEALTKQLEASIQSLLGYVGDLKDGLGKCVGFIYKSLRCKQSRERIDSLLQAKGQAEELLTHCRPKLLHSLFSQLGHLLRKIKPYENSLGCYQKAIELWRTHAVTFLGQGIALANLERYEEALESYQKAIELNPKSADAWGGRGALLANLERYEEALEAFQKAIELDSKHVDAWGDRGTVLAYLERYEEALEAFQKAIELDSKYVNAWINKSDSLRHMKRYEQALVSCYQAFELAPNNFESLNSQALTLSFLKNFDKAIIAIDEAINLEPQEVLLRANRGIILARASRYTEAFAECEQAIKQDSKHVSGYYAKACYYALQGEVEQSVDNLQKAIDIKPRLSRREAKHNPDFDSIRDDERFRALVYP